MRLVGLVLLVGCGSNLTSTNVNKDGQLVDEVDEDAPVIGHEPITATMPFGEDVAITATVTDEGSGLLFVYLHYKNETGGEADWQDVVMIGTEDEYAQTIQGERMQGGGIYYYIEAIDKATNVTLAPDDGDGDPYHFRLAD